MKCPSCQRPVDHEAESCYSCGYSARAAMLQFGSNLVRLRRIHDAADCLRVSDTHEISAKFDELEARFPQLIFATYLGELNGKISIGELGFWLLNQSSIEGSSLSRPNDNAILLLVDVESEQAGIALGYLTELLLTEEDCQRALMASRGHFINGEFSEAVMALFSKLEKTLAKKARELKNESRAKKAHVVLRSSKGMNTLTLPRPYIPVQFDENNRARQEVLDEGYQSVHEEHSR